MTGFFLVLAIGAGFLALVAVAFWLAEMTETTRRVKREQRDFQKWNKQQSNKRP
jgi:hypothetical protein